MAGPAETLAIVIVGAVVVMVCGRLIVDAIDWLLDKSV